MHKPFIASTMLMTLLTACNVKNSSAPVSGDQTAPAPTPNETSGPEENPQRLWRAIKIFRSYTGDPSCDSIEVRINDDGSWKSIQCEDVREGTLVNQDRAKIESLAMETLDTTEARVCPEIMKLDADYVYVESDEASPETFRSFDPDGSCYHGGSREVSKLRRAMREIRIKLTGYEPAGN